jgi:hypothetical protein
MSRTPTSRNNNRIIVDEDGYIPATSGKKTLGLIANLKDDATDLTTVSSAIHINSGGTIRGIFRGDSVTRDITVLTGLSYKYEYSRIYSTGTDATGIVFI